MYFYRLKIHVFMNYIIFKEKKNVHFNKKGYNIYNIQVLQSIKA